MPNSASSPVRTFEIIASIVLFIFCGYWALNVIACEIKSTMIGHIRREIQTLAEQMSFVEPIEAVQETTRKIASVGSDKDSFSDKLLRLSGEIGQDFWGQPYKYKYIRNDKGQMSFVVVVSKGQNSQLETNIMDLKLKELPSGFIHLSGDDIGYIKRIDSSNKY